MNLNQAMRNAIINIGYGMRLGEHIFDFLAGLDEPFRHAFFLHCLHLVRFDAFSPYVRSPCDVERHLGCDSFMNQRNHDVIAGRDGFRQGRPFVADQILGIVDPHVRPMRKSADPDQFAKPFGSGFLQHLPYEPGTKFRHTQSSHRTFLAALQSTPAPR